MTVAPSETCPSAAITTESPRRTQITVVERIRRPSPRSRGWAKPDGSVETLTGTDDLVREGKGGFMGTCQYIVNPVAAFLYPSSLLATGIPRIRKSQKRNARRSERDASARPCRALQRRQIAIGTDIQLLAIQLHLVLHQILGRQAVAL